MIFGCVSETPAQPQGTSQVQQNCRIVQETVPVVVEECGDISYTEQVCERRNLLFETVETAPIHICALSSEICGGAPLSSCASCRNAMTRCSMYIKNTNSKTGQWTVGANFSIRNAVFAREPVTKTIAPNETILFDFQQFYDPGEPINSASCKIFIISPAILDDCREITRTKLDCVNVTKMATVEKEVCD